MRSKARFFFCKIGNLANMQTPLGNLVLKQVLETIRKNLQQRQRTFKNTLAKILKPPAIAIGGLYPPPTTKGLSFELQKP